MRPVGNNQVNPFFNQQMVNPANTQVSYQVNLQVRQCGSLTMTPPYNSQTMHPLNRCSFPPPMNPRIPNVNPQLMGPGGPGPSVNPQLMGPPGSVPPVNQQMIQMRNPSVPQQHIPNMNGLPVPSMNCPPGMSHGPPNMPPVNLAQILQSLTSQMMPPMNSQSFQSVNCQNIRPPMSHIPSATPQPIQPSMLQSIQAVNSPNYPPNVPNVNYPNMPILNPQTVTPVRGQTNTPMVNPQTFPPSSSPQNFSSSNSPHNFPQTGNPQNFPSIANPQSFPPTANPQNFPPTANPQSFPPTANPQNFPPTANPQNFPPTANPQNFPPTANPQNFPPTANPQNFPPTANPQNFPSRANPQNFPPAVNPQNFPPTAIRQIFPPIANLQKFLQTLNPQTFLPPGSQQVNPNAKSNAKKEKPKSKPRKRKKANGLTVFWEDPEYKKSKEIPSQSDKKKKESKTLTNGLNKPKKVNPKKEVKKDGKKKKEKKVGTSKPNNVPLSNNSKIKNPPLITIKAKGDNKLDEKKTQYFKNLRSSKPAPGKDHPKKKFNENDKIKAKILKIFSLMQKLKGVCKKLWQNVAANGEFKDNPGVREEITKFCIVSHKFVCEVDCIIKLNKKERPSSAEKASKEAITKSKNSSGASNSKSKQTSKQAKTSEATKQANQRKKRNIPCTVKLVLKKLDELDALGLCFVNINGIFIKRYCSVIIKLRKSLNALLDKSKASLRKKRLKIPKQPRLPHWGAIMLNCYGKTTYAKALQLASKNIKFKSFGIQCIKQRRSVTGGMILEVFAQKNYEEKTDKLAAKLREIYGSLEIRVTRPQKFGDLVINRLDPSATVEQITEQLAKLANCSTDVFKTGSRGKTCIWVRCPLNIAIQLDQKTMKMESTVARIDLKAKKLVRCYKCFNMGHVKQLCPSLFDHNNLCFKCGQKDHEARTCQNAPKCLTCYDNSLPTCHRLGGEKCPSAIPKFIKWPTKNTTKAGNSNKKGGKESKGKKANKGKKAEPGSASTACVPPAPNQVRGRN